MHIFLRIKMISILLCFTSLVLVLSLLWSRRHFYWLHHKLKNETWSLPLLGNSLLFLGDDEVRMKSLQRFGSLAIKQGGLTSLWFGPRLFVVVADAKIAEIVLKTNLEKDDVMHVAREILGYGSIFAPVNIWRPRRKMIAPTFSMRNLLSFVDIFSLQSCIMVEQLRGAAGNGTFSIWKYLTTYTMDSVCESAMGVKVNAQRHPDQPFLDAFEQHCQMGAPRLVQPPIVQKVYTFLPIYKLYMKHIYCMWDFVDSIIKIKRKELKEKEEKQSQSQYNDSKEQTPLKTFLELFIESSGFTDRELREETLVLLLAATDTSAVGAAFTCLMLARHPLIQDKVYEEMKEVFGDSKAPITAADLPKLKYLEAVVKESLRLYPPVPVIVRKCDKDLQLPSGLTIVKGTSMMINIWAIHRNPEYWGEDVEDFKPDRFIGSTSLHPAAFVPFSHGPRSCLGYQYAMMSMKTAMANLVRNYRFRPALPVLGANAPLRVKFDIMMKHVDNFELQLEART